MDLDKVVREVAERYRCRMVLKLFAEAIRQTRVSPVRHADAQILPFNKAG